MLNCSYPLPQTCCTAFLPIRMGFARGFRQRPRSLVQFPRPSDVSTTAQGYRFMEVLIDTETLPISAAEAKLSGFKVHKN
ncbi:hypothetical protein AGR8A_Cc30172 [Agrobacterium fabrum str. J-07]|nr:hypothetical protein AGR8A_Cc30172 [Agrobacterium fabrum str. J-07]